MIQLPLAGSLKTPSASYSKVTVEVK